MKDSPTDIGNALGALATWAEANLKLTRNGAESAVSQLVYRLNAAPITITVPGSALFGAGVPKGSKTQYKAATEQRLATEQTGALGKGDDIVYHVGAFKDPVFVDERGEDYLRFRMWKDRLMAQNMGLSAEEMPKYGAMNLNWDINYGTSSNAKLSDLSQGQRDLRSADWTKLSTEDKKKRVKVSKLAGENYYGDVHLVLKESVRRVGRVVFTATDHGGPHADPIMALYDAVTGRTITSLKSGPNRGLLMQAFNAAGSLPANKLMDALNLEAQIYGKLDMATDVKEIAVAPYVSDKVKKNVKAFCKKHRIAYLSIAEDDPKLLNAKLGGLSSDDVVKSLGLTGQTT